MSLFFCMEDSYQTFESPAGGSFRDRNSRFLAFTYPVGSVEQVNEILSGLRKKYHDARHHCYAFRINPEKELFRMNDDGEPSGTAGKPIYNQLVANRLFNALIVVVRYFGGTLLGTGGLIYAYKSAAMDAISKTPVITRYVEDQFRLIFVYEKLNAVMKVIKDEDLITLNAKYEMECSLTVAVRRSSSQQVIGKILAIGDIHAEQLQSD